MPNSSKNVLIIGHVWPEPESSAAGTRMLQLIELFQENRYTVTFASTAQRSDVSATLEIAQLSIVLNCDSFNARLVKLQPSIVVFDRFMTEEQFGWRVADVCPTAIRILNTEDLHCLRRSRQLSVSKPDDAKIDVVDEDLTLREIASIYRSDLTLAVSNFEINLLKTEFNIESSLLLYLPIFASPQERVKSFADRKDFMFIGNFLHKPNFDAVHYLKSKIWPIIRQELAVKLHIYGAYMPQSIMDMNDVRSGFIVHGRAESSREVIESARAMLAPLRFGAGIKGKLLESMQCGTPSVTTTIGSEGIGDGSRWNGYISDDPDWFAAAATQLYTDEGKWLSAQENGYEILIEGFDRRLFTDLFRETIQKLEANLGHHRSRNFIGRMLNHHSHRSTEFMSRWIELKNKQ